jgi:3-deoxy-D-manno-octulosonic-acid transferase
MISAYRIFYPIFFVVCLILSLPLRKIRKGLFARFRTQRALENACSSWNEELDRYWFHCSSAGELEQTLPLLTSLKKKRPQSIIVLTFFSPSAEKALRLEKERAVSLHSAVPWDFACYSPLDFKQSINRFITVLRPRAYVTINKELWPETLYQLRKQGVPLFLFAGSFRNTKWFLKTWYQWVLPFFTEIGTIDEDTAELCQAFTTVTVSLVGEPRVERILNRVSSAPTRLPGLFFFENQVILIGASLWEEDFNVLVPSMRQILSEFKETRLLLVPHEPQPKRIQRWKSNLDKNGIPVRLWSHWLKSPDTHSHLLVDQVGILTELFSIASIVLVGGSFKKRVHNVLEPFFSGCALLTGPHIHNSSEALALRELGLLKSETNSEQLSKEIRTLLLSNVNKSELKKRARHLFTNHEKASEHYIQLMLNRCLSETQTISNIQTET